MKRTDYQHLYYAKLASSRTDRHQRERETEQLDEYGVATYQDPVQTPEEILLAKEEANALVDAIDSLAWPRVILAMKMHYGIGCEQHTLDEIGEIFDVTRERVRQIIHKGIRALQHPYRMKKLRPELYERERARRDAAAKQAIADDKARVEREMQEARERQANRWHERHEERIEAEKRYAERLKVIQLEQHRKNVQLLAERAYEEAHYINSLWDMELIRREIAADQERVLAERRKEVKIGVVWVTKSKSKRERDWLHVATKEIA